MEKIDAKRGPQNDTHRLLWDHRVGFLRFWSVLERGETLMNFNWQKIGPTNQRNRKTPRRRPAPNETSRAEAEEGGGGR